MPRDRASVLSWRAHSNRPFWHVFTATVHSDVGRHPKISMHHPCPPRRQVRQERSPCIKNPLGVDPQGLRSRLNKAVYNFMHGIGTAFPLQEWFDVPGPCDIVKRTTVKQALKGAAG